MVVDRQPEESLVDLHREVEKAVQELDIRLIDLAMDIRSSDEDVQSFLKQLIPLVAAMWIERWLECDKADGVSGPELSEARDHIFSTINFNLDALIAKRAGVLL